MKIDEFDQIVVTVVAQLVCLHAVQSDVADLFAKSVGDVHVVAPCSHWLRIQTRLRIHL